MTEEDASSLNTIFTEPVERVQCRQCGRVVDLRGAEPFSERFCPSCGARKKVPARLGAYLLLDCMGEGGMGAVFRAQDPSLDRVVAVKVLNRTLGQDPAAIEAFRREARAAARFNHPHAAQIFTFGEAHGQPYIVMEFVSGRPINELVEESGPLDQALVTRVGLQTTEALAHAATVNLMHGDIKPENILVEKSGQSKLIDFGLASLVEQKTHAQTWGSPYYMAPERILRQKTDFRADIYSLGTTLYEAMTGRTPFVGDSVRQVFDAHLDGKPTALSVCRSDIDPEVVRIIMRMIRRQPVDRYPNYDSLSGDLQRTLNRLGSYPGQGRRIATHGNPTSFNVRSEPATPAASPRSVPKPQTPQRPRSFPAPEAANTSRNIPPYHERPTEQKRRQPHPRDIATENAGASAIQMRKENHGHVAGQDGRAVYKARPPVAVPKTQHEPNMLPFIVAFGLVALVAIGFFVASLSSSSGLSPVPAQSSGPSPLLRQTKPSAGSEQATDDSAVTKPGRAVTIHVLDNDATETDGTQPTIDTITNPNNGVAAVTRNGIGYRPQPGFSGEDQFQYTVRYRSGSRSTAKVTVRTESN